MGKKSERVKERESKKINPSRELQTMAELLALSAKGFRVFKKGELVEGTVVEKTGKAVYVAIGGKTDGLILDKDFQAYRDYVDRLKVGDKIEVIVFQPENDKGQILLSLKKSASAGLWKDFEQKMLSGETAAVIGKEVNQGGLVVQVKGLYGFIPSSQLNPGRGTNFKKLIGQTITVRVIEVDQAKNRLIFSERESPEPSLSQMQADLLAEVKIGALLEGEITGITPFGFFVKAKSGKQTLEGLVHISEISWEKVAKPEDFCKIGDKVKVQVIGVDRKTGKLGFSLKRLISDPWENVEEKYPIDSSVKGEVMRIAPYGIFVKLEPGIEALIHASKLVGDKVFKEGEKIECFVESVDKRKRKMSLGLMLKEKPVGYK